MSIDVMKQALEAMDKRDYEMADHILCRAIEQAEKQEPFGYFQYAMHFDAWVQNRDSNKGVAFYTTPPAAQPAAPEGWKLVPAVPTNEWVSNLAKMQSGGLEEVPFVEIHQCISELLDAAPNPPAAQRQWVSLTDEQINELRQQYGVTSNGRGIKEFTYVCDFVRAIEAKLRENGGQV